MRWSVLTLLLATVAPLVGQEAAAEHAGSLADFELMQYVASGRMPPQRVIELDNNSEILVACRAGCTPDELGRAGIEVTDSQLQLMQVMNLVRESEGRWFTSFPILDVDQSAKLRGEAEALAEQAVSELGREIAALAESIADGGLEDHAFPVFFSYVFDGMVWGFLEEYQRVPRRRLSAGRPFWAGEIWAVAPVREDRVGTIAISERGITMKVLTSPQVESSFEPLVDGRELIKSAMRDLAGDEKISSVESIELLQSFGIIGDDGDLAVPIIEPLTGEDPVFQAAEELTSDFVDWLLEALEFERLGAAFGLSGDAQTLVVVYHEMMASLMSILERDDLVSRPAALAGVPEGPDRSLGQLVVVVDRSVPVPRDDDESVMTDSQPEEGVER